MTTSARGLSFDRIIRSMTSATDVVARIVMVLAVLFAMIVGVTGICGTRMTVLMVCATSVASACDRKKVRMTCSSYFARFWGVSGMIRMVF